MRRRRPVASRELSLALATDEIARESTQSVRFFFVWVLSATDSRRKLSLLRTLFLPTPERDLDSLSEEEVATMLLVSAALSAKAAATRPKKRRFWVRPCLRSREVAGHASRLLPALRTHDLEHFRE